MCPGFLLFYKHQVFKQPHYNATSHNMFLMKYFENMSLEILHWVVFLGGTWVFMNGSNTKMWSDGTSQSARKRRTAISGDDR
jgi:hypothetical protein